MPIVVGIDGTGSDVFPGTKRDARYDRAFEKSFVRKICGGNSPNKLYLRGPVVLGGGLVEAIDQGSEFILDLKNRGNEEDVLVTGYSRGAAGVVSMCERLRKRGVNVKAMMLFDCVDRHLVVDAEYISENVENVMHVIRSPQSNSRKGFGNDGLKYTGKTVYLGPYPFMCTHGGMGGTPWPKPEDKEKTDRIKEGTFGAKTNITYEQDERGSKEVWDYCQNFLNEYAFFS